MLVLGGQPPAAGFLHESVQEQVDALPSRPAPSGPVQRATIETYTVTHDRDGDPERAIIAALDGSGARHLTETRDRDRLTELLADDCCGQPAR
jgi:acetyl-CoA C-acetyltransferase